MRLSDFTFYTENCESISIDPKWIGDFVCSDIKTEVSRVACNAIIERQFVDDFYIEIAAGANYKYEQFGNEAWVTEVFDRLYKWDDIVSIAFSLFDDSTAEIKMYSYCLDWRGSEEENPLQSSYLSKCGNLYIKVCKDKNLGDYFDKAEIDDPAMMKFKFDMYGIKD